MANDLLDAPDYNSDDDMELATSGIRLTNYIIDLILFYIIYMALLVGFYANDPEGIEQLGENSILDRIVTMVSYGVFMLIQEVIFKGRSVGKFITKTAAVDESGYPPSIGVIVTRNLCRIVPFDQLTFIWSDNNRGWHDQWSNTYVVKVQK